MLIEKNLAATSFMGAPEDSLLTADVYQISNADILNNLPKIDNLGDQKKIADELHGGLGMLSKLPLKTNPLLAGKLTLNGALSGAVGGVLNKLSGAAASKLNALVGPSVLSRLGSTGITGIPGISPNSLTSLSSLLNGNNALAAIGSSLKASMSTSLGTFIQSSGVLTKIPAANISSSYQISSLINDVVGSKNPITIVDKDSTAGIISGLAKAATNAGLINGFSSVASLAGGDKSILASAAASTLLSAARAGKIGSIKDVLGVVGGAVARPMANSIVNGVCSAYKAAASAKESVQDYRDVVSTFNNLNPSWMKNDKYVTDPVTGVKVLQRGIDLSSVSCGSADFKSMMAQGGNSEVDGDLKYLAMVTAFPTVSPEVELKKSFPMTYTTITSNSSQAALDSVTNAVNSLHGNLLAGEPSMKAGLYA